MNKQHLQHSLVEANQASAQHLQFPRDQIQLPLHRVCMFCEHVGDDLRILSFGRHYLSFGRASAERQLLRVIVPLSP